MAVQSLENLENLEKSGNKICVRENLEKSGNFTEYAKNDNNNRLNIEIPKLQHKNVSKIPWLFQVFPYTNFILWLFQVFQTLDNHEDKN